MISIQKAKKNELKQLKSLRLRSILEEPILLSYTTYHEEKKESSFWWKNFFFSKENITFTIKNNKKIIGMVRFEKEPGSKARHKGTIRSVYVVPEERNKGFGEKFMKMTIKYIFKIKHITKIDVAICSTNYKMITILENLNFKEWGEEPQAIYYNGAYYSDKLFCLIKENKT